MSKDRLLPTTTPQSQPFWDGCRERELRVQRCTACETSWFPPSSLCPHCLSNEFGWVATLGKGKVHSFVVYHRAYHPSLADAAPYVVALVELDEGPRMISNIVGCAAGEVRCEMPVEVTFEKVSDSVVLPKFQPIGRS